MIDYERGLYVVVQQLERGPSPFPLEHGFSVGVAYRVLGIYNPSESGECWLILSNDDNQLWYISQRHVRTWSLCPAASEFRMVIDNVAVAELRRRSAHGRP